MPSRGVAQHVEAWQPGCEKMENEKIKRKWRENEEMERKWRENEEIERDSLSTFSFLSIHFLFKKLSHFIALLS